VEISQEYGSSIEETMAEEAKTEKISVEERMVSL
jgi:hypothetical protein